MEVTVRVQVGLGEPYCIVEDANDKSLIYRNPTLAKGVLEQIQKNSHPLPILTRGSKKVGLEWFGPDAMSTRPGRRVLGSWEFTLDGNDDNVQAIGFEREADPRVWLSEFFGIRS